MKSTFFTSLLLSTCLPTVGLLAGEASAQVYEPPMVKVPAGSFQLGSTEYEDSQPLKTLNVESFYVGQYEVTRLEFAQFVQDTHYPVPNECYHQIGKWWFEQSSEGSWQRNAINHGMLEPVSCVGYDAAIAYSQWLNKKTGQTYRLLSEAEWEYLATAFAQAQDSSACSYANIADQRAESAALTQFNTSYKNLIEIEACDDKAGTVNIVGQYQPNSLGVYDLLGNVNEFVEDCYTTSYEAMPPDGRAVSDNTCEAVVLRGGAWHWPLWSARIRDAKPRDWIGVLEGFRLAMDIPANDHYNIRVADPLRAEIAKAHTARKVPSELPSKVEGLVLQDLHDSVRITWTDSKMPNEEYVIFKNDYVKGRYERIASSSHADIAIAKPRARSAQFAIAIQRDDVIGPYSEAATFNAAPIMLGGQFPAENFSDMNNALVFPYDETNEFVTGPLSGVGETSVTYALKSEMDSEYSLKLIGSGQGPIEFNAYIDNEPIGTARLNDVEELILPLTKGIHQLTLSTTAQGFQLDSISLIPKA